MAGSALAGVGGSVVPTFPAGPLNVGATFNASLILTNESDETDADDLINVTNIRLTPSCGSGVGTCASPDLNVFDLPATGTGAALSACAGITFTVGAPNVTTGEVDLTPGAAFTLGPADNSGGPTICEIEFTGIQVLRIPSVDSSANAGIQTNTLGRADFASGTSQPFSSAGSSTTTITGPALTITKDPNAGVINAGQTATFTIVVSNLNGTGLADNVNISDPLPNVPGLVWVLAPPVAGCSITGATSPQTLNCTTLDIAAGGSATLTVSAVTNAQACTVMPNVVSLNGTNGFTFPEPITDAGQITCQQVTADLSITKTDGVATVNTGASTTYTVVVTNGGPSAANGAVVTDPAAAGLTKTAAACTGATGGAACPASVTVAALEGAGVVIPTLPSGGTVTFTITATVTATSGTVTNTAVVAPPAGTTDPTPGNNTASDTNNVQPIADLSITKTDGVSGVNSGASTTYTVVVTNGGPSAANNAVVTDPAAAGLTKTAAACTGATGGAACPAVVTVALLEGAGVVIPTLPSGGTVTFTITATVTATSGTVTNTAVVAPPAGTTDPTPGNNTASDTNNINTFTLSISKNASASIVPPGSSPLTFTVVVTNNGPAAANGTVITDPAIANFTVDFLSCIAGGGAVCPVAPTIAQLQGAGITIATFPAGGTITLVLDGTSTLTSGSMTNTATATPPAGTPVQAVSASATVSTQVAVIPTLGTGTLIGLMLLLAGMAGAVIRRRT